MSEELKMWIKKAGEIMLTHTKKINVHVDNFASIKEALLALHEKVEILEIQVKVLTEQKYINVPLSEKTVTKQDDGNLKAVAKQNDRFPPDFNKNYEEALKGWYK